MIGHLLASFQSQNLQKVCQICITKTKGKENAQIYISDK